MALDIPLGEAQFLEETLGIQLYHQNHWLGMFTFYVAPRREQL